MFAIFSHIKSENEFGRSAGGILLGSCLSSHEFIGNAVNKSTG